MEWFIAGTQQALFAVDGKGALTKAAARASDAATARITSPAPGTIVALDPDIPPQRQRLAFSAQGRDVRWRMDGKEFARGNEAKWLPWPGRHAVQLVDAGGDVLDETRIEVRGAAAKATPRR